MTTRRESILAAIRTALTGTTVEKEIIGGSTIIFPEPVVENIDEQVLTE